MLYHRCHTCKVSLLCGGVCGIGSDPTCKTTWDSSHIYMASHLLKE